MKFDLLKDEDMHKINFLLHSEDMLTRCDVVEYLSDYIDDFKILNIILKMLDDKSYLVRCEVCDALYNAKEEFILEKLILRLRKEKKSIVRMYIISTICNIIKNNKSYVKYINSLKIFYKKEKSKRVIISYLVLFYSINKNDKYLNNALMYLNDSDYHIRCNVINLVNNVIDNNNLNEIVKAYNNRLKIEKVFCVRDLIENSLNCIDII